ncbi:hypothetical protein RB3449 [Rhodopirellula baltica SH 1]|uniref:Uncharacterized protein n=1 Tax=Rhodopirellula baltica (strain DSM 10527 / NCIMB 13988 / SH1) TaxID=243090 RepID=Q7UU82_RHOBA|nr:hypothetical protein RB3449 [Rhodopirellula baltica SH 1]
MSVGLWSTPKRRKHAELDAHLHDRSLPAQQASPFFAQSLILGREQTIPRVLA